MLLGLDPSIVLDTEAEDLPIIQAILRRAQRFRSEYDGDLAEAIGAATAAKVVPPLAKHITKLVRALRASS